MSFYLFVFGSAGLSSGCREPWATLHFSVWVSHCDGLSCWGPGALGDRAAVVEAHGLNSCGSWVHTPNCSLACGIFPDQGLNLCLLHWQLDYSVSHEGSPVFLLITDILGLPLGVLKCNSSVIWSLTIFVMKRSNKIKITCCTMCTSLC